MCVFHLYIFAGLWLLLLRGAADRCTSLMKRRRGSLLRPDEPLQKKWLKAGFIGWNLIDPSVGSAFRENNLLSHGERAGQMLG